MGRDGLGVWDGNVKLMIVLTINITKFTELKKKKERKHSNFRRTFPEKMKIGYTGSFCCGEVKTNPTSIHKDAGSIPGLTWWVGDLVLL